MDLRYQYRMNEEIMLLSNRLIYNDKLRCGNDKVAGQSLNLDRKPCAALFRGCTCGEETGGCWIQDLMDEKYVCAVIKANGRIKAVFVDTDLVPAQDSKAGDLVQNPTEARLVCQVSLASVCSCDGGQ